MYKMRVLAGIHSIVSSTKFIKNPLHELATEGGTEDEKNDWGTVPFLTDSNSLGSTGKWKGKCGRYMVDG